MAEETDLLAHISDSVRLQPLPFILKLYQILSTPAYNPYVCWGSHGLSVFVRDVESFCTQVLPKHFKHNNFGSFARQLNIYGFRKVGDGEFKHEMFVRASPHLLGRIRRRTTKFKQARGTSGSSLSAADAPNYLDAEPLSVGSCWPSPPLSASGAAVLPMDTVDADDLLPQPLPVPLPPAADETMLGAASSADSPPALAGTLGGDELQRLREVNALMAGQIDRLQRAYEATQGSVSVMLDIVTRSVRDQQQMESRFSSMAQQLADCKASLSLLLGSRVQDEAVATTFPAASDLTRPAELTAAELSSQIQKSFQQESNYFSMTDGSDEVFNFFSSLGAPDLG
eukprot:TRINITY_DN2305_c0_g2_i1.p2 TRINITY_DN2305_c0_g2~~TRINITY_DN2305_c0_g2_i1.p2  ORF type:complete len:341 (-),score=97.49 TRINITY_DN2305_c0_g2_i1:2441-3463(-)